jgi:hypothetical protein
MSGGVSVSMAQADSIGSGLESSMVEVARDPEGRDDVSGVVSGDGDGSGWCASCIGGIGVVDEAGAPPVASELAPKRAR